jgi:hypothetical protein
MNVYTDPELLDIAGALEKLRALPLDGARSDEREAARAVAEGGAHAVVPVVAPTVAPTPVVRGPFEAPADTRAGAAAPGPPAPSGRNNLHASARQDELSAAQLG